MPNDEWITPQETIKRARLVLRGITLDPASTKNANRIVGAKKFYTKEQDGLSESWENQRVWLNPPYSKGLIGKFVNKLISTKNVEAIMLVNSSTDAMWFHKLLHHSNSVCFRKGRIKFLSESLEPIGRPRYANVFFYFGLYRETFKMVFSRVGFVLARP